MCDELAKDADVIDHLCVFPQISSLPEVTSTDRNSVHGEVEMTKTADLLGYSIDKFRGFSSLPGVTSTDGNANSAEDEITKGADLLLHFIDNIPPISSLPDVTSTDVSVNSVDSEVEELKRKKRRRKSGARKHRAGKNQKRGRYKPYCKRSYAERKRADERNIRRSNRKREHLRSCGIPLAPLNTTQFLVDDNLEASSISKKLEDSMVANSLSRRLEGDNADARDFHDGWRDNFRDLSEAKYGKADVDDFQEIWSHRFEHCSRRDLVLWFLSLEDDVEELEKALRGDEKIAIFREEIRRYECEIEALTKLNEELTKMVEDLPCKDEHAKMLKDFPVEDGKVADEEDQHLEDDSPSADVV